MPWFCLCVKEEWPLDYLENCSGNLTFPTRSGLISSQLLLSSTSADFLRKYVSSWRTNFQITLLLMRHLYFYVVSSDRLIFSMPADNDLDHCLNGYPFNRFVSQGCEQCPL